MLKLGLQKGLFSEEPVPKVVLSGFRHVVSALLVCQRNL